MPRRRPEGVEIATSRLAGVEPRHLATLAAVAEEGTFTAAAARLGCVQSAVSQRIARMERVLGTLLVERDAGHRGAALTRAGAVVAAHARAILAQLDAAVADVRTLGSDDRR